MIQKLLTLALALCIGLCLLTGCQQGPAPEKPQIQGTAPTLPTLKAGGAGAPAMKPSPD